MVNLTALNNITPPSINTSLVSNADDIIPNIIENANTLTDGFYGTLALVVFFIVIFYLLYRDDGDIRMDIPTSILISSGFTVIIGLIMLVTGLTSDIKATMWFFGIFIIDIIGIYLLKSRGNF